MGNSSKPNNDNLGIVSRDYWPMKVAILIVFICCIAAIIENGQL
jgi:hypothetical protein